MICFSGSFICARFCFESWVWMVLTGLDKTVFEMDEAVEVWHGRLGSSFGDAFRLFKRFYRKVLMKHSVFAGMSPSQLVEWQVNARGREAFRLKGLAQRWIDSHNWRYKTKQTYLSMVSSFWLHNHAPFPADPSFHFSSDVPPVEGQLDLESFRRIVLNSNKMYRAVFLMMAESLMGEREVVYVNNNLWREVLKHISKNDGPFRLTLPGRKKNRNVKNFYTILNTKGDWAEAFRDYMRSNPHPVLGALYHNSRGKPLATRNIRYYFHCRAVEAGVVKQFTPTCSMCGGETARFRKYKDNYKVGYKCKECGNVD